MNGGSCVKPKVTDQNDIAYNYTTYRSLIPSFLPHIQIERKLLAAKLRDEAWEN